MYNSILNGGEKAISRCVYFCEEADGSWAARITTDFPTCRAFFVSEEGDYPVKVCWEQQQESDNATAIAQLCHNRETLIATLNKCANHNYHIRSLWDYNTTPGTALIEESFKS